jgi:hypothetical protein
MPAAGAMARAELSCPTTATPASPTRPFTAAKYFASESRNVRWVLSPTEPASENSTTVITMRMPSTRLKVLKNLESCLLTMLPAVRD